MRLALALAVLTVSACSPGAAARRFPLTGTVVSHDTSSSRVVLSHDAVEGLMPAMSMPFDVAGVAPLMRPGDRITATLIVTGSRSWVEEVRITGIGPVSGRAGPASGRAAPGMPVPAFPLVDQAGRSFTTASFAGRVLVVTFIYTRCPLPDFCPLMVRHLESVRRRANEEGIGSRLALLGVTLDPAFDTPAVLRAYGQGMLKGVDRFNQWTLASGSAAQIDDVAEFFSVAYQPDRGFITHALSTTVVSHDGRIVRTFASNSWRPDELFDVVKRAIERGVAD